jgi:uncharacterized membrane protein
MNRIIAWFLMKTRQVIFYAHAYRYKKTGNKVEQKYLYYIEHVKLPFKSKFRGMVIDSWQKMGRDRA